MRKNKDQARLRLVVDNSGYRSGRRRFRDTPDTASIESTRSAGARPSASHCDTEPCDLSPSARASALWPPTASHAARSAAREPGISEDVLTDMNAINAQTINPVNAETGNGASENRRMPRKAMVPASDFWKRLEEALRDNPSWQPVNPNNIAKKLDMSQGSVHRWYTGIGIPELKTALVLAKAGGVCIDWLLNNVRPKYPIAKDPMLRRLLEISDQLDSSARAVVLRAAENEQMRQEREGAEEKRKA